MAKKKKNDNDDGLTEMIYDMTGLEPHFILIGLGVLIIILILIGLFYFDMLPDFDSIIKSIMPSTDATPNTTTTTTTSTTTSNATAPLAATMPKVTSTSGIFGQPDQLTPPPPLKVIGGLINSRRR